MFCPTCDAPCFKATVISVQRCVQVITLTDDDRVKEVIEEDTQALEPPDWRCPTCQSTMLFKNELPKNVYVEAEPVFFHGDAMKMWFRETPRDIFIMAASAHLAGQPDTKGFTMGPSIQDDTSHRDDDVHQYRRFSRYMVRQLSAWKRPRGLSPTAWENLRHWASRRLNKWK